MVAPSPFVYWAQDANNIYLKVDLKDIKDEKVDLGKNDLSVTAYGVGAHGASKYSFSLDFFGDIDSEDDVHMTKATARAYEFSLKKARSAWWPRLIKRQQKPAWLKVDFEKWKSEDDDMSEVENELAATKDIMGDYPELFEKLKKDEFGYIKEDVKKVYLVFYNLSQFVFFMYILIVMGIRFMKEGSASAQGDYEAVGAVLKFAQTLQWLEVMHPLFGYTKSGMLFPFCQVAGRCFVLFAMVDAEPRMQTKPVVSYLILVWSLVEVIRYPYYISELYKRNVYLLTWMRYSVWVILYPLGFVCEGIVMLRNIIYMEETQRFVISMPNKWNFTFHTPTAIRVYLLLFFIPGAFLLMGHMYRARNKKLGTRRWKSKTN